MSNYILTTLGGMIIGLAVSLMLLWNGRVTGVSGIVYGAIIKPIKKDRAWRWSFIGGLIVGGVILQLILKPVKFSSANR